MSEHDNSAWQGHPVFGSRGYAPLRAATEAGLSMLEGEPISSPADLPEHRVEVHAFKDADCALCFIAGLRTAGLGNSIDVTWQPGTTQSNRIVFLAKFDEPRPISDTLAEALPAVIHHPSGYDGRAIAEFHKREMERRSQEEKRVRGAQEPFRNALSTAGATILDHGADWLRFLIDNKSFLASWKGNGSVVLECDVEECLQSNMDVEPDVREAATGSGFTFDGEDRCIRSDYLRTPEETAHAAVAMSAAWDACNEARRAAWERAFRASMKMTASRRRFLAAGSEYGIFAYVRRGNRRARAGAEDIGASELNNLERIGWIEKGGTGGYVVTDEGRAAAGLEAAPVPGL